MTVNLLRIRRFVLSRTRVWAPVGVSWKVETPGTAHRIILYQVEQARTGPCQPGDAPGQLSDLLAETWTIQARWP